MMGELDSLIDHAFTLFIVPNAGSLNCKRSSLMFELRKNSKIQQSIQTAVMLLFSLKRVKSSVISGKTEISYVVSSVQQNPQLLFDHLKKNRDLERSSFGLGIVSTSLGQITIALDANLPFVLQALPQSASMLKES